MLIFFIISARNEELSAFQKNVEPLLAHAVAYFFWRIWTL